jgi:hypothetical protein
MMRPSRPAIVAWAAIVLAFIVGWLAYGDTILASLRLWFGS